MIGEAIYDLLKNHPAIYALVNGRVTPIAFAETGAFPALTYNTRNVRDISCRAVTNEREGLLEIGILADNTVQLETLADTLSESLHNYQGVHAGYVLSLQLSDDEFDERIEDLRAYFKALQFNFQTNKLN